MDGVSNFFPGNFKGGIGGEIDGEETRVADGEVVVVGVSSLEDEAINFELRRKGSIGDGKTRSAPDEAENDWSLVMGHQI